MIWSEGCVNSDRGKKPDPVLAHLIVLDPGHFHAALLQKSMNADVDSTVYVFAPEGQDLQSHLALIDGYNHRANDPTHWKENVYTAPDYLEKMLKTKPGNVVVIAGNNRMKTDYIQRSIAAGLNVLADKPMAITARDFIKLKEAFAEAGKHRVLLYDIMTERYEITNILQKAFSGMKDVFGELQKGSLEDPAVISGSVHYFFKEVSGAPLIRPDWYFDTDQEGEGIVDVTTHMIDLIQWACFPDVNLDYKKDIQMLAAKHWATKLNPAQFRQVTNRNDYPAFLRKDVKDSLLNVYSNGEMNYTIRATHVRVSVNWEFEAPKGSGDTFYSILRGTKANLVIRQGAEQQYKPVLYIEPVMKDDQNNWKQAVEKGLDSIRETYPGAGVERK